MAEDRMPDGVVMPWDAYTDLHLALMRRGLFDLLDQLVGAVRAVDEYAPNRWWPPVKVSSPDGSRVAPGVASEASHLGESLVVEDLGDGTQRSPGLPTDGPAS